METWQEERIRETPKVVRKRLAKSEMWLAIAASHAVNAIGTPAYDGKDLPFDADLMKRYGLSREDLHKLGQQIAAELETRAMRLGYEDAWID